MGVSITSSTVQIDGKDKTQWTIETDDGTYTAVDKNGNNRLDSGELTSALNSSGNPLSTENLAEAKFKIAMENNPTDKEIISYDKFRKQQDKLASTQTTSTTSTTSTKKKGFWGKVGDFFTKALPFIPLGLGITGAITAWSRGGGANDTLIAMTSIANMTTNTMSTLAAMKALDTVSSRDFSVDGIGSGLNYGATGSLGLDDFSSYFTALNSLGGIDNTTATAAQRRTYMNQLATTCENAELGVFSEANEEWIKENVLDDEDAEYDDDTIAIAKQIVQTPHIPINYINIDKDNLDENKLSKKEAATLNKLINSYEKATGDKCLDVMSKENYEKLIELMSRKGDDAVLTPEELEWLKDIANKKSSRGIRS